MDNTGATGMQNEIEGEQRSASVLLYISLGMYVLLLIVNFAKWELIDIMGLFLFAFAELCLWGMFGILTLVSLFHFILSVRRKRWQAFWPLAVTIVTLLTVLFFPFTEISLENNFEGKLKAREEVVSMIQAGKLPLEELANDIGYVVHLPRKYKHVSKDGRVLVQRKGDRLVVFFYTFLGILDDFSGYAYVSDDSSLAEYDFGGQFVVIEKKRDHWFWAVAT